MRSLHAPTDLAVQFGSLRFANPIVAASGTFGYGSEFVTIVPPKELGAITVKSLACFAHDGNAPLRTTEAAGGGMLNSVGLAGPGVDAWIRDELPELEREAATIIVSIWGRTLDDYRSAAQSVHSLAGRVAAIELNLSCPNLEGHEMFAQSVVATAATVAACVGAVPVLAKLTAQVGDVVAIARAAIDSGAAGLTLINTIPGLMIDTGTRRPKLGAGNGGLSGPPIHAVALRTVHDVSQALPGIPIVGTGGVRRGEDVAAMLLAGATAVGVGTATFANPRATMWIRDDFARWCARRRVRNAQELIGSLGWPQ